MYKQTSPWSVLLSNSTLSKAIHISLLLFFHLKNSSVFFLRDCFYHLIILDNAFSGK